MFPWFDSFKLTFKLLDPVNTNTKIPIANRSIKGISKHTLLELTLYIFATYIVAILLHTIIVKLFGVSFDDSSGHMGGVFGSAVALGGAYFAVKLAGIAVHLQNSQNSLLESQDTRDRLQNHFEVLDLISKQIEAATEPIVYLIKGFEKLYLSAVFTQKYVDEYVEKWGELERHSDDYRKEYDNNAEQCCKEFATIEEYIKSKHDTILSPIQRKIKDYGTLKLEVELKKIIDYFGQLSITGNPVSASVLHSIGNGNGFKVGPFDVSVSEFSLWHAHFYGYWIKLRELNALSNDEFLHRLKINQIYVAQAKDKDGHKFNHRALRDLVALSLLVDESLSPMNMMMDFVNSLPNGSDILDAIEVLLPESMPKKLRESIQDFSLSDHIDKSFLIAKQGYDKFQPIRLPIGS